jgi:hypothetical protein
MDHETDPDAIIKRKIARTTDRIARWDREAGAGEVAWVGWPEYQKFCATMAEAAREKSARLEVELQRLQRERHLVAVHEMAPRLGRRRLQTAERS